MLISFTSLSHWHEAPIILNPTLGPVFTADNKLGYSAAEVVEHNSNPDSDHTVLDIFSLKYTIVWLMVKDLNLTMLAKS